MDNIYRFACKELDDLDRRAEEKGGMTLQDFQYADMLNHLKKTMKINKQMDEAEGDGYSNRMYWDVPYYGNSYARGRNVRRDSMGRYSRSDGYSGHPDSRETMEYLRMAMDNAPDDDTRQKIERLMSGMNG